MIKYLNRFCAHDTAVAVIEKRYPAHHVDLGELRDRINTLIDVGVVRTIPHLRQLIHESVDGVVVVAVAHDKVAYDYGKTKYDIVIATKDNYNNWFEYHFHTKILKNRLIETHEEVR